MGRILIPKTNRIPYSTSQIVLAGFVDSNVGVDQTSPITLTKASPPYQNEWMSSGGEGYYVIVYRSSPNNPNGIWYVILQQFGEEGFGQVISASNPSTSTSEIPTTGWVLEPGVTGTITITADNRKNISIKKQNLGGGRLLSPKLNQRIIPYFIIIQSGLAYYDNGNSVTVSAGASIRFFTNSTTSGLNTLVNASGNLVIGFSSTFIDLSYPNSGTYFITLTQPGNAFYKSATLTITVTVLAAPVGSGSSGVGIGGGGV